MHNVLSLPGCLQGKVWCASVHCYPLVYNLTFSLRHTFSQGLLCRYLGIITELKMFEQGSWFNEISLSDPCHYHIIFNPCCPKI